MISSDGAQLIAQVVPVGLLIIALEARQVRRTELWVRVLLAFGGILAVVPGVLAVAICVMWVSDGRVIEGSWAGFVGYGASAVYVLATFVLIQLVTQLLVVSPDRTDRR